MFEVFPSSYLPPVQYFAAMMSPEKIQIEQWENFQKQTLRNRCYILSPNGIQCLSVPVKHQSGGKLLIKDVKISYAEPWQRTHWRAITAAYNRSPFFEFYAEDFLKFYSTSYCTLLEFNTSLLKVLLSALHLEKEILFTEKYTDASIGHYNFQKTKTLQRYNQVFSYKFGFAPDLSIIDLLFNTGNKAVSYLQPDF